MGTEPLAHLKSSYNADQPTHCVPGTVNETRGTVGGPDTRRPADSGRYDPMSIAYYFVVHEILGPLDSDEPEQPVDSCSTSGCAPPPRYTKKPIHRFLFLYGVVFILTPLLVFISVSIPSISVHTIASEDSILHTLVASLLWSAVFVAGTRALGTLLLLPETALCMALHSSCCCSFMCIRSLLVHESRTDEPPVVMMDYSLVFMGLVVAGKCFCLAMSGGTPVSMFTPLSFSANHLACILALQLVGRHIWYAVGCVSDLAIAGKRNQ